MKFCTRCGAQLTSQETTAIQTAEERFDDYLEGLFWITVLGLGIILGGAALLTKVLHFSSGVGIAFLVLSSVAFLINFGLNLWGALRVARSLKKEGAESLQAPRDTNKMLPPEGPMPAELAQSAASIITPSITEDTTRSLDPIPK
jgi:hypothetical protein